MLLSGKTLKELISASHSIAGKMFLKSSLTNKNKFERNQMDEFVLETVKIGELKKIK